MIVVRRTLAAIDSLAHEITRNGAQAVPVVTDGTGE
jgi:hypothetical protein